MKAVQLNMAFMRQSQDLLHTSRLIVERLKSRNFVQEFRARFALQKPCLEPCHQPINTNSSQVLYEMLLLRLIVGSSIRVSFQLLAGAFPNMKVLPRREKLSVPVALSLAAESFLVFVKEQPG